MISVLIPVYNTSRYVEQCVRSVTGQTYKDIEVILVNDCSTDDSLVRCQALAAADKRIYVIDLPENIGQSRNRFVGLGVARGKYVMFLDSDDWLNGMDTLKIMHDEAERTGADYVEVASQRVIGRHGWIKRKGGGAQNKLIEPPELFPKYYLSFFGVNILSVTLWGKLYRRSTLERANLQPWKYSMGEDLHFNMMLFPHLQRISLLGLVGHNYRFGGMTTKYNPQLFPSLSDLYELKKELIDRYEYHEADKFIRYEIKNVLRSDICQAIRFIRDEAQVRKLIDERLALPYWVDLESLEKRDDMVNAILAKDADEIYRVCSDREHSEHWTYLRNRMLSALLSKI